jgi:putative transposase
VRVDPAKPHDVRVGRRLFADHLAEPPDVRAIVADRGYSGLRALANAKGLTLDIKGPPTGSKGFVPMKPLVRVEHAFARLGRWRRLSRCFEGTVESAQAWFEVACLAYLFTRLRAEPP